MNTETDKSAGAARLVGQVTAAYQNKHSLRIVGGGSKEFYGRAINTDGVLNVADYSGIGAYDPSELVITARAGTPLSEVYKLLEEHHQQLPFEPPSFSDNATVGGMVATGLSGGSRPYFGGVRDNVLGVKIINGRGELLTFGGQVIKNVAGYDVSRLIVGALGILAVLLEVSIRVIPKPVMHRTLCYSLSLARALAFLSELHKKALPLSATAWQDGVLSIRISGAEAVLNEAQQSIGGEVRQDADNFWRDLREHRLDFFTDDAPLWRLSVAPNADIAETSGGQLLEWGGALRWIKSAAPVAEMQAIAKAAGGHATLFCSPKDKEADVFSPLSPLVMKLHRRLKHAFDPENILNPGRMYKDL